jgi:hypothetical protein
MSKQTIDTSEILKGAKGLNHVNVGTKASSKSDPDEKESLSQLGQDRTLSLPDLSPLSLSLFSL